MRLICFLISIVSPLCLFSQTAIDSLQTIPSQKKLEIEYCFGADRLFPVDEKKIYLPKTIRESRTSNSVYNLDYTEFTDIPQFHASVFTGVMTTMNFGEDYKLNFDLFAEDRGQSFGSLRLSKVIIYPRIYGSISKKLNDKLSLHINVGDLIKFKHNYGLTMNNIDVQGITLKLDYKKFWFMYTLIGDISQHIGLNISDVYSYKVGYDSKSKNGALLSFGSSLDVLLLLNPLDSLNPASSIFSFFGKYDRDNISIYSEIGYRFTGANFDEKIGALLGFNLDPIDNGKTKVSIGFNGRYYGNAFNTQFLNKSARYRDLTNLNLHGNYIGEYLYPLVNSYRRFDQWSVYTEYQNQSLVSISTTIDLERKLFKDLFYFIDLESNLINESFRVNGFYLFYRTGIKLKLPGELNFQLYGTNKLMNLDVHYQTFYQTNVPLFGFTISRLNNL